MYGDRGLCTTVLTPAVNWHDRVEIFYIMRDLFYHPFPYEMIYRMRPLIMRSTITTYDIVL